MVLLVLIAYWHNGQPSNKNACSLCFVFVTHGFRQECNIHHIFIIGKLALTIIRLVIRSLSLRVHICRILLLNLHISFLIDIYSLLRVSILLFHQDFSFGLSSLSIYFHDVLTIWVIDFKILGCVFNSHEFFITFSISACLFQSSHCM